MASVLGEGNSQRKILCAAWELLSSHVLTLWLGAWELCPAPKAWVVSIERRHCARLVPRESESLASRLCAVIG